jgi:hypothetical protein
LDLLRDWTQHVVTVTQRTDVSGTMDWMVAALLLGLAEIE